jgi:phosphoribosylaminoimidazole (AIR) synthetase
MVVCVAAADADNTLALLNERGEQAWVLGEIQATEGKPQVVYTGDARRG